MTDKEAGFVIGSLLFFFPLSFLIYSLTLSANKSSFAGQHSFVFMMILVSLMLVGWTIAIDSVEGETDG